VALGGSAAFVFGGDFVRLSQQAAGESRPIVIDADQISTWIEGDQRILLVRGQVLVQQGVVRARFQEGVIFLDLKKRESTQIWNADLYGEGDFDLKNGAESNYGKTGLIDLHTSGDLKVTAHKGKVAQQALRDDPVYLRAVVRREQQLGSPQASVEKPQPANAIQTVAFNTPAEPTQNPPAGAAPGLPPVPSSTPPSLPPPGAVPLMPPVPSGGDVTPAQPRGGAPPGAAAPRGPFGGILGGGPPTAPGKPAPVKQFSIVPRSTSSGASLQEQKSPSGESIGYGTGGFYINVWTVDELGVASDLVDIETDRVIVWDHDGEPAPADAAKNPDEHSSRKLEFYLGGNVVIRQKVVKTIIGPLGPATTVSERVFRGDEIYYDASRNVAIAVRGDVDFQQPGVPDHIHFKADELEQLSPTQFKGLRGEFFSSRLPSDPDLKAEFANATMTERPVKRSGLLGFFGIVDEIDDTERFVDARDVTFSLADTPFFYLPVLRGDANDPLGPVNNFSFGYNKIFGAEVSVGLDVFNLLGVHRPLDTRWRLDLSYLSARGPAAGTIFDTAGKKLFGTDATYTAQVKLWGIHDTGLDNLGGIRTDLPHPTWRYDTELRAKVLDLPWGFSAQGQLVGLSDQNVYEQYYKPLFDNALNQETFVYAKQQQDAWAWTVLGETRLRNWVTETEWLPRLDGYLLGQSFFDRLTYNAHASAGYARLMTTESDSPPIVPTDFNTNTARVDLMQKISAPFYLGPVKVSPYALLDLTAYSRDLNGDSTGRVYGGGGVNASIPFTRLYPDVQSLLWNLNGINHKIVFNANFFAADATERYTNLPQLDRLYDDAVDQSQRQWQQVLPLYNPGNATYLTTSPLFNPQLYAIRRLVMNDTDTLDRIEEVNLDLRQRWQTKRGFPGEQHIVDWMTLDISGTIYPRPDRDNFGAYTSFLEYDWVWNIGDRTSLVSSGWLDPISDGPRVFTVGAFFNRPDRTSFFLGYREIEPVGSRAVSAAVTYVFSPKYAMTASTTYDFGTNQALSNSLVMTRMGSDLQLSIGISYNALQNAFGAFVELVPNLLAAKLQPGVSSGLLKH
jgi:hypothetical protein